MKRVITSIIVTFLFISCSSKEKKEQTVNQTDSLSQAIKVVQANDKDSLLSIAIDTISPVKESLPTQAQIVFKERKSIKLFSDSLFKVQPYHFIEWDGKDRFFITDLDLKKIAIFNQQGERIKVIGGSGQGPGEFSQMCYPIAYKDTLFVPDTRVYKINKFDFSGNFLNAKNWSDDTDIFPGYVRDCKNNLMLVNKNGSMTSDDGKVEGFYILNIYNRDFSFISTPHKVIKPYERGVVNLDEVSPVACLNLDGTINLFKGSKDRYEIEVIDQKGKKVRTISKNYRKHFYSDSLIAKWKSRSNLKYVGKTRDAVEDMKVDGLGRLWVRSPSDKKFRDEDYDVFIDGKFSQSVKLLPGMKNDFRFIGKFVLVLDQETIRVFEVG